MRNIIAFAAVVLIGLDAHAESFDGRFDEGYGLLRAGDPDGALEAFQRMLTEAPDSELVQYSIAAAQYEKGLKDLEAGATEASFESLYRAKVGFDALRNAAHRFVREHAPFNAVNCQAQIARHLDAETQYNERVQAFQDSIQDYKALLSQLEDHQGAKTNLNHVRYTLKTMLQDPPPEQEQAEDGDGGEQGRGDQGDEDQQGEQDPDAQEGEQDQSDNEQNSEMSDDQTPGGDPRDTAAQGDALDDKNIEAILQSLEETNRREQKNLRKAKGPSRLREGKWW